MAIRNSNKLVLTLLGVAVGAIALLLAAVAWLLADARGAGDSSDSVGSPTETSEPSEIEVVAENIGDIRLETPQDIFWYPITDSNPSVFTATSSSGFTQDELGAGLAAAHFYQRMSGVEEGSVEAIEQHSLGEAKQQWQQTIRETRALIEGEGQASEVAEQLGQSAVTGWVVEVFEPQAATVNLAVLAADTKLTARVELSWFDDDWRVVIPTSTGTPGDTRVVTRWPDLDIDLSEAFE